MCRCRPPITLDAAKPALPAASQSLLLTNGLPSDQGDKMSSISGPLLRVPHKSSTNGDEGFGTATVTWWRTIASG